mmetsp:Transcript_13096/g.36169  ORF Transcript_13096/g.36169 Transcript_13096/m.36169 type:complete len:244 (+) Transcript_13096:956-1687(+)
MANLAEVASEIGISNDIPNDISSEEISTGGGVWIDLGVGRKRQTSVLGQRSFAEEAVVIGFECLAGVEWCVLLEQDWIKNSYDGCEDDGCSHVLMHREAFLEKDSAEEHAERNRCLRQEDDEGAWQVGTAENLETRTHGIQSAHDDEGTLGHLPMTGPDGVVEPSKVADWKDIDECDRYVHQVGVYGQEGGVVVPAWRTKGHVRLCTVVHGYVIVCGVEQLRSSLWQWPIPEAKDVRAGRVEA